MTNIGRTMLLKAATGESGFEFDGFAVGNGILQEGDSLTDRLDLENMVIDDIPITAASYDNENHTAQLTGEFTNESGILEDFPWRELGLYAHGEDNVKRLYAYAYEEEYSELIPASGSAVLTKQTIIVTVAIGETNNITVRVKLPDATYAMAEDLEEHVQNTNNPHGVTKEQLGAAAAVHNHSAGQITSGTLSVARGGTGVATLQALADSLSSLMSLGGFVCGTFMGTGALRKDFSLGFKPSAVVIFTITGGTASSALSTITFAPGKNQYHAGCGSSFLTATADALINRGHGGAAVTNTGFVISNGSGSRADINANGVLYAYIAFK